MQRDGNVEQLFEQVGQCNLEILPHWGAGARVQASLVNLGLKGQLVDKQVGQDDKMAKIGNLAQDGSAK